MVVGTALAARAAATSPWGIDYVGSDLAVNRTGDAIQSLAAGDFGRFFATQPSIGPVSVLVRAPFAAIAGISHHLTSLAPKYHGRPPVVIPQALYDSQLRLYRFGVFPCLLALVLLAAAAAVALARCRRNWYVQALVAGIVLCIPLWNGALLAGHPEEFLTTALTLGAVLTSVRGRPTAAGILMGLALASKQWALLALPAAAIAAPVGSRRRVLVLAVGVWAAFMAVMAIGDPDRFFAAAKAPGAFAHGYADTFSVWFQLAPHHDRTVFDGLHSVRLPHRRLPGLIEDVLHPLTVLIAAALSLWLFRRSPRRIGAAAIFQLLAAIFLMRCLLDPVTNDYYHAPFLASLALYEGFSERRWPVLAVLATAAFVPHVGSDVAAKSVANAVYLAWAIPLLAFLLWSLRRSTAPEAVGSGRDCP